MIVARLHCRKKCALTQEIRLGSPDRFSSGEGGVWGLPALLASFPGAQKIGGSAWYTLLSQARLPRVFGELGNYCIRLRVTRSYIIGILESSQVMAVSSGKEVAFNQAVLYALGKVGKPGMVLKNGHTLAYAGSPSSFFTATRNIRPRQATWEIFQLTLNSKQPASVSGIHFRKAETAQQSCRHRAWRTMFYTRGFPLIAER